MKRAQIDGVELAYHEEGSGDDVILLLHGVTANHRVWEPIYTTLANRFTVLVFDQRGHGRSSKPESGYTDYGYSDDVRGILGTIDASRRVFIVGHSLGARNAIVSAARFPEYIAGIVAIDFTPFIETEVFDTLEKRVVGGNQVFENMKDIETYLQHRYALMPHDAIQRRAAYGYELRDTKYQALADASAMQQTVQGLRADLAPFVEQLAVPSLIVRGEKSALVTEQAFEKTRELRPDLQYAQVSDADHYVPEEQPEQLIDLITTFIDETK